MTTKQALDGDGRQPDAASMPTRALTNLLTNALTNAPASAPTNAPTSAPASAPASASTRAAPLAPNGGVGSGALPRGLAVALAAGAYALPLLLSRSTTPTPDHPRVFLWYRLLRQPGFKPPDIAVPIAWTVIETGLAVAAYRLLRQPTSPDRNRALGWLAVNITAIGAWSRLFFGGRNLPASTIAAAAMIGGGVGYVVQARRADRVAAAAGVPLTLWLGFATVLTAAIWRRNRHG